MVLLLILIALLAELFRSMTAAVALSSLQNVQTSQLHQPTPARITTIAPTTSTIYKRKENCTSPEYASVPWPWGTGGNAQSHLSHLTCGFSKTNGNGKDSQDSKSSLLVYLQQETIPLLEKNFAQECRRLVVYGAALGAKYMRGAPNGNDDPFEYHKHHGRCFFLFVLEQDIPNMEQNATFSSSPLTMNGQFWLIPLPRSVLPYTNMRRNTKILKYTGQYIFPFVQERIVWQDAKFRFFVWDRTPVNYHDAMNVFPTTPTDNSSGGSRPQDEPCIQAMGLPPHENSFGQVAKTKDYRPQYRDHCKTIIKAIKGRPSVTDMPIEVIDSLCQSYESKLFVAPGQQQQAPQQTIPTIPLTLDLGLVDSAFLVYNVANPKCRDWNAEFDCSLLDELHCHADRDQLAIPYVLYRMGLRVEVVGDIMPEGDPQQVHAPKQHLQLVLPSSGDDDDEKHYNQISYTDHDLNSSSSHPMVFITKSECHWYYTRLSDCNRSTRPLEVQSNVATVLPEHLLFRVPKLAILVTGTTNRFLLNSTVEHVLRPLTSHGEKQYRVDYFALLTETVGQAYRQDLEYMNHVVGDPLFHGKNLSRVASDVIGESGATVQAFLVLPDALPIDQKLLGEGPEFDVRRFPTFDSRNPNRTAAGNQNMIKLFNHQQYLWDTELRRVEKVHGDYDYIMIIRDDALWIKDFDLTKLLESNPDADAYIQACDKRVPPMHVREVNDHGIVIKRKKADVVGRYLSSLAATDRKACDSRSGLLPARGCNSEMLLNWILNQNGITVELVSQSLLPFERSLAVQTEDGRTQYCFHKFCQSYAAPLDIPENMKRCLTLKF